MVTVIEQSDRIQSRQNGEDRVGCHRLILSARDQTRRPYQ